MVSWYFSFWLFWLGEKGIIWGFWAFHGERMEGTAWNFPYWCIFTTLRTDYILVMVCWFSSFKCHFDLVTRVKYGVSGHLQENAWREWPKILRTDQSWPFSELIRFWSCSVDLSHCGASLTGHILVGALSGERPGVTVEEAYFRCFASSSVYLFFAWKWRLFIGIVLWHIYRLTLCIGT